MKRLFVGVLLGLAAFSASGQLYKSKNEAGRVVYSDIGCGNEGVPVRIVIPNVVSAKEAEASSAYYRAQQGRFEKQEKQQWEQVKSTVEAAQRAAAAATPKPKLSPPAEDTGFPKNVTYSEPAPRPGQTSEPWKNSRLPNASR